MNQSQFRLSQPRRAFLPGEFRRTPSPGPSDRPAVCVHGDGSTLRNSGWMSCQPGSGPSNCTSARPFWLTATTRPGTAGEAGQLRPAGVGLHPLARVLALELFHSFG